mgnify:CR=1 FL=1
MERAVMSKNDLLLCFSASKLEIRVSIYACPYKNMSNSVEMEINLNELVEELGEEIRKILFQSIAEIF